MWSNEKSSIVADFQEYFDVELATTPEQMAKVFHIRYRVYCEEFGYEEADAFPDHLETDQFDPQSIHCLINHRSSGIPAACVRIVEVDHKTLMPMEQFCHNSLDSNLFDQHAVNRASMCEFSRLAVDGAFRRRAGEHASRFGDFTSMDCTTREVRSFSLIAIAAFISAFAVSELIGRTEVFAMMEPFLPRLLRRSGVIVKRVGEDVDYHGIRAPYFIKSGDAVASIPPELQQLCHAISNKFVRDISSGKMQAAG
ncbi:MAG: N-acyl amino acid synthase of PEP-CTERM/exosortase system [Halioglobus sp.]|jgi:N-acyl amino acid synthase of PEP-CTERM/exosortase system